MEHRNVPELPSLSPSKLQGLLSLSLAVLLSAVPACSCPSSGAPLPGSQRRRRSSSLDGLTSLTRRGHCAVSGVRRSGDECADRLSIPSAVVVSIPAVGCWSRGLFSIPRLDLICEDRAAAAAILCGVFFLAGFVAGDGACRAAAGVEKGLRRFSGRSRGDLRGRAGGEKIAFLGGDGERSAGTQDTVSRVEARMSSSSLRDFSAAAAGESVAALIARVFIGTNSDKTSIKSLGRSKLRSRCFNSSFRASQDWFSKSARLFTGTRSKHSTGMYSSPDGSPTIFILKISA